MACSVCLGKKVSRAVVISEIFLTNQCLILGDKGEQIPNLEGKLRDITQTCESKIEAQNAEIKKFKETMNSNFATRDQHVSRLEGSLRDVEAQNIEIKKLQETLAKQHELTSTLLLTMNLGINSQEKKLQDLQGIQNEANSKLQELGNDFQGLQNNLELSQNKTLDACYNIFEGKCDEDLCVTY